MKFCQNPSFGWGDRVQASFFLTKFEIQSASVALKMRSRSPKSNHFFSMPQWCFYVSLVKIHQLIQEIECRQGSFLVFIVWWPWKLGQGHQNLLKSLNHLIVRIYEYMKFCQNPSFGSRDRVQTSIFWSNSENFKVFIVLWPWKLGQGHQNLFESLHRLNVTVMFSAILGLEFTCDVIILYVT